MSFLLNIKEFKKLLWARNQKETKILSYVTTSNLSKVEISGNILTSKWDNHIMEKPFFDMFCFFIAILPTINKLVIKYNFIFKIE